MIRRAMNGALTCWDAVVAQQDDMSNVVAADLLATCDLSNCQVVVRRRMQVDVVTACTSSATSSVVCQAQQCTSRLPVMQS